jgi:hypothetical protein
MFKRFCQYITQLNLYSGDESLTNEEQFMSTRLYFGLLAVFILILLTFASLTIPAYTIVVTSPSLSLFDYLSNRYPSTFSCACSQPVIPYDAFLSFAPQYHQVCSSLFVSQSWISTLFSFQLDHYYPLDFRTAASSQFQVIASLCRFAVQSIADYVKTFSMSQLVTVSALSRAAFNGQSETLAQQLQTGTIVDANLIDEYVAFIIAQNFLSSSLRTSTYFITYTGYSDYDSTKYLWNENLTGESITDFCFCYETYSCSPNARLYNLTLLYDSISIFRPDSSPLHVPGIKAGCIPHDSILNSTLECFYNATCIEMLIQFMGGTTFPDPLDDTVQSRFNPNTTVSSMFAELFIEEWRYISNFTGYFATCAPASCSYSYTERVNAAYMLITFFGFIGGVTVVLGFIAPVLVKNSVRRIKTKCCGQNEHEEQIPTVNDEAATRLSKYTM